jgi:quinoprotein dehydrogenase-associated probable ABC transporter substrate-binding protein
MCSRCRELGVAALAALGLALAASAHARELVVCADPDNLPYSSAAGGGFENRIAQLVADEIGATLRYAWQPFRRGVVRKTLGARACDMLAGVPLGLDDVATTSAYYRSGYAFVQRRDGAAPIVSFDDARLRRARVGVQLVGDDMAATPAALALARRGIVDNVRGFPVYGAEPAAQRMVDAIDAGLLDVALIWGPQAGYFAQRARSPLAVTLAADDRAAEPQRFAIAIAVREDNPALRDELDRALGRARDRVRAVLAEYAVPQDDDPMRADEGAAR